MAKELTQRALRNESGRVMRDLDRGETFIVTRRGVPVAELRPIRRRTFVDVQSLIDDFAGAEAIDLVDLRADLDSVADQDPSPRS